MALSRTGTLLISAVARCASGCGDSHEAVTRDILNTQKELCAVLDEVKDDASAKAAVPRVKAISDILQALQLQNALEEMPTPPGN